MDPRTNTADPLSRGPLIVESAGHCTDCRACVFACPVGAIEPRGARAAIRHDRCVGCGACASACTTGVTIRDDLPAVRALLASGRPVTALLATEFLTALHPMTADEVGRALAAAGFTIAETTLLGEELVAEEYRRLHEREDTLLTLRSTCPVAVSFVRKYHPALVPALAPIVPPYVAQARLIRRSYGADHAVVYIGPCFARKDDYADPAFGGVIDAAIDFIELRRLFAESGEPDESAASVGLQIPHLDRERSASDGYPRATLAAYGRSDTRLHVVRGIAEIDQLLVALAAGEAAPAVIDMLYCPSCLDGPAVSPGLSRYARRTVEMRAFRGPAVSRASADALLRALPEVETRRSFTPDPVVAAPVYGDRRGPAAARTAAAATPGAWEGGGFAEHGRLEFERHRRYATQLSLAVVEFDDPADALAAGDAFAAAAQRIAGLIRGTDVFARLGENRYGLLLPGIGKTAAFATAERLRLTLCEHSTDAAPGYTGQVGVCASFGVAAASGHTSDFPALLEAASAALDAAIDAGKGRVHLAAG